MVTLFCWIYIESYIIWQERWIEDRSMMVNLVHEPAFSENSIFWISRNLPDRLEKGGWDVNEPWVWVGMFKWATGEETRFGISNMESPFNPQYYLVIMLIVCGVTNISLQTLN